MRRYARPLLLIGVIASYFVAATLLLRFGLERYIIVSSISGHVLASRTVGAGMAGCVVIFPGRHGPSPAYEAAMLPPLRERGVRVYLAAYPKSASLHEIRTLARLFVIDVTRECAPDNVVLVGRSLGSMVAAYASRDARIAGLLLESTSPRFSTALRGEFRRRWYLRPMMLLPIEHLVPEDYSLNAALNGADLPEIVIFQGIEDSQTPLVDLTPRGALPRGVTLLPVSGANHSNVFSLALPKYVATIFNMLERSRN